MTEQLYVETAGNTPADPALWSQVKSAAKKKFTVYPSAYANGWAVQEYKRRGGKWRESSAEQAGDRVPVSEPFATERASKDEGLGKWFAEKWVDISRTNSDGSHPACGRPSAGMSQADYAKAYPKCVPASKAAGMSDAAKKSAVDRKRDADNAGGSGKGQAPKHVSTEKSADQPSATSKDKNPKGGLSAAGHKKFGTKPGVKNYSSAGEADKKRWVRWALRFTKTPRPLKDDSGKPTRYALMFQAWGEPVPSSDSAVRAVHSKAESRAKTLKMGQHSEKASLEDLSELAAWEIELANDPGAPYAGALQHTRLVPDIPPHSFHLSSSGRCLTCNQINDHPIHGIRELTERQAVSLVQPTVHAAYTGSGCMVALYPNEEGLAGIETSGDLPLEARGDMHVTLAYMKTTPEGEDFDRLKSVVEDMARTHGPITGVWGGTARFNPSEGSDGKPVLVALPDLPDLPAFRQNLVDALDAAGFDVAKDHGYQPHLTVAYDDNGRVRATGDLTFDQLTLKTADRWDFPLTDEIEVPGAPDEGDEPVKEAADAGAAVDAGSAHAEENDFGAFLKDLTERAKTYAEKRRIAMESALSATAILQVSERTMPEVPDEVQVPQEKAFLTEVLGKTLITAPAAVWEKALTPNEHFLWMQGRFVGAEKANRNGAYWTTGDLELGEPTVKHGPLNWLHEDRHVIGSIADAKLVRPGKEVASDQLAEPHIVAVAAAWKWLYPDECYVMEQASDQHKLYYSMECVSKEVACVGDGSCGKTVPYMDTIKKELAYKLCSHMRERSASRRFVDPTFLGGAVIVPPVRPGWGEANASVMREASSLAERAFEDAGRPDMTASEWELVMAQIVRYGQVAAYGSTR